MQLHVFVTTRMKVSNTFFSHVRFWLERNTAFSGLSFPSILSTENILFGLTERAKSRDVFITNFQLLHGKHYIFKCRNVGIVHLYLPFITFYIILDFHTTEKYIAERSTKINMRETRWCLIFLNFRKKLFEQVSRF